MANVTIKNKRKQTIKIAVKDAGGHLQDVPLDGFQTHGPIPEGDVGEYTKKLAQQGHVQIRYAS